MTAQPRWRRRRIRTVRINAFAWQTRLETRRECLTRALGLRRTEAKVRTPYDDLLDTLAARVRSELEHPTTEDA